MAIIPARGGSKRVPRKNLVVIDGKPILTRVIETVLEANVFSKVVVSSEDDEVLALADKAGVVSHRRPLALSDDITHVGPVVDEYLSCEKDPLETVCLVYATALLLRPEDLRAAHKLLLDPSVGSILSIAEFPSPIQRAYEVSDGGEIYMVNPEFSEYRSQDLPKRYRDAGLFSWWKVSDLSNLERRGLIVPKFSAADIDDQEDLMVALALFRSLGGHGNNQPPISG